MPTAPMKNWTLTPESFEELLDWLHPDPEKAAQEYENLRRRLIKFFTCRGCYDPEDLTDKTFDRVAGKLPEIKPRYEGPRAPYFYSVGDRIRQESNRRITITLPPPAPPDETPEELELKHQCLDECMKALTLDNRELVSQYYQQEKRGKIDHRKNLAEQFEITLNALRIRAFRIRASLQDCVKACLQRRLNEMG
jgi:DNA-directed RNA polymerase specialized sigma24 family protein